MLFRPLDTLAFAFERLRQHFMLAVWVLVGLMVAAGLVSGLTLYVDAVYTDLLDSRLGEPPYAWRTRYLGAWNGAIGREAVERGNIAALSAFATEIGLPIERKATFIRAGAGTGRLGNWSLGNLALGTLTGTDDQITITAGEWPPSAYEAGDPIPVLASQSLMERAGLQVGDVVTINRTGGTLSVKIAALWTPKNASDADWIFPPKFFDDVLLFTADDFWTSVAVGDTPIDEADWYIVFNGDEIRASEVDNLLTRAGNAWRTIEAALPGVREDLSPRTALTEFNTESSQLQQQLALIVMPVGGLAIYFLTLVAGLWVERQAPEDVKLRSRGASRRWIATIHAIMWASLAIIAATLGAFIAPLLVQIVARTTSFLRFDSPTSITHVSLTLEPILMGALTCGLAALGGLLMAWRSTAQDVNSYRRANARAQKAWWQRSQLDLIIAGLAGYLLWNLASQGGISAQADAPFADPVTFAGPTLLSFGLVLVFLRILPMLLGAGARLMTLTRDIPLLMALRELTRGAGRYRGALLMTAFTLALTGFTASMASTLDRSLEDTVDYRIGADLVVQPATDAITEDDDTSDTGQAQTTVTGYNVPPVGDLEKIEGIDSVSRVGKYTARLSVGSQRVDGTVMGIDRAVLGQIARFRDDYAGESLGSLMNALAMSRTGILLSRTAAESLNVQIGQEVGFELSALGQWFTLRLPVVGIVDYFPTLDPAAEGFFAIANLDPLFELAGTPLPHDFWVDVADGVDSATVREAIFASGFPALRALTPYEALNTARAEPARRGVLGFLSVGFVAAIALTLIATLIQITASFRAQASQLGALRAMGLSGTAVGGYVVLLQGLLAVSGIAAGTSIGLATALSYLPLLDFSGGLPPYLVRIGWQEIAQVYLVFAGILLLMTAITTIVIARARLTTILRLGES